MKKQNLIKFILTSVALIFSFSVLAEDDKNNLKTQGHYAGFDLIRTDAWYNVSEDYTDPIYRDTFFEATYRNITEGFGFNYKYAVNKNNFFIAPEVFFEFNSLGSNRVKGRIAGTSLQIKKRYGGKVNFGYDITAWFSPYAFIGYSYIDSTITTGTFAQDNVTTFRSTKKTTNDLAILGLGVLKHINDDYSVNLEYSRQEFNARGSIAPQTFWANNQYFRTKIQVIKLGISYNF